MSVVTTLCDAAWVAPLFSNQKPLISGQRLGWFVEDGNLFDNFDVEALEGWDVRGRIGEEPDFVDAEVGEDLAAESDLAEDALVVAVFFAGAWFALF